MYSGGDVMSVLIMGMMLIIVFQLNDVISLLQKLVTEKKDKE